MVSIHSWHEKYIRHKIWKKQAAVGLILFCAATGVTQAHEEGDSGHIIPHEFAGLQFEGGTTWFLQATSGAKKDTSALSYTLDLSIEKDFEDGGKAFVVFEAGDGQGIDEDIGTLSIVNYDAFLTTSSNVSGDKITTLNISQAYYERSFWGGDLVVDAGKQDIHSLTDDNAYANDETDQFLSGMFTRMAGTVYKEMDHYYAPGITVQYQPEGPVGVTLIVANGNGSGFSDLFSQLYYVGQVNFMPKIAGYEGNYRIYGILDSRDSTDTTFTKISNSKKDENTAWGLSFDQALPGGVGVFARYVSQDDKFVENLAESSWSFGALVEGVRWGRGHDSFGIGYGSVNINDDPKVLAAAGLINSDDETHFEVFYKFGYKDHFSFTPDIQVVNNIGGDSGADQVIVYGVRGQLNF